MRASRTAIALATLGALAFAAWGVIASTGGDVAQTASAAVGDPPFIIEVNEQGFNPRSCTVSRNDTSIRFKNVGTQVHRIQRKDIGGLPPLWDSGDLQPGEFSQERNYNAALDDLYEDVYFPGHTVRVQAPVNPSSPTNCAKEAPTPTPTPIRTPTPTPAAPTAEQRVPRCIGSLGCGVAAIVAKD